jgi:hypothetical protein
MEVPGCRHPGRCTVSEAMTLICPGCFELSPVDQSSAACAMQKTILLRHLIMKSPGLCSARAVRTLSNRTVYPQICFKLDRGLQTLGASSPARGLRVTVGSHFSHAKSHFWPVGGPGAFILSSLQAPGCQQPSSGARRGCVMGHQQSWSLIRRLQSGTYETG